MLPLNDKIENLEATLIKDILYFRDFELVLVMLEFACEVEKIGEVLVYVLEILKVFSVGMQDHDFFSLAGPGDRFDELTGLDTYGRAR